MNHTGVRSTGWDLQARTKLELGADMKRNDGPITLAFLKEAVRGQEPLVCETKM